MEEESKMIAVLIAAGYSNAEIRTLREDKVAFKERVLVIQHGRTRREIEKAGTWELMKKTIKVMAEISWDEKNKSRSD